MRITTKSKYGMRMIVEIAAQPEGKAASLKAIARKINASEKYLEQIVIPLTKAGYLKSLRQKWEDEDAVVRYSGMMAALSGAEGVVDVSNLLINGGTANISCDGVPVDGTFSLTVQNLE